MSLLTPKRPFSAVAGTALCVCGVVVSLLGAPGPAHAAVACRADPIVTLSNGLVVNFGATIYDTPADLTGVTYTLHAPVGTSLVSVVYPLDPNGIPQTFTFYADNPANVWDSYTFVDTKTPGVAVQATADVAGLAVFSATGTDHQNVHVHVQAGGGDGGSTMAGVSSRGRGDHGHGD